MADVFISYARSKASVAQLMADRLTTHGYSVWMDSALPSHRTYAEVIAEELKNAKSVIVIWCPDATNSQWVRSEADRARNLRKLVQTSIGAPELPMPFDQLQCLSIDGWTGEADAPGWIGVVGSVSALVGRPAGDETRAQPKASPLNATPVLAVLPFDNLSSDAEMEFFSDGVSEEILSRLTRGSKLQVIGKTSSFQFRGASKSNAALALRATHILDGSVRRSADRARISAHLVETTSELCLWSDKFDRNLDDIFAVQDEISERIADVLNTKFFPPSARQIDPAVFDLFLRARGMPITEDALGRTITLLREVTRLAPEFADGWGELAFRLARRAADLPFRRRGPVRSEAEASLTRACALDPANRPAVFAKLTLMAPFGDFVAHQRLLEAGAPFLDTDADHLSHQAFLAECVGRNQDSIRLAERAYALDSLNMFASGMYGQTLWRAGRLSEGRAAMEHTLLTWPEDHHTAAVLMVAAAKSGDWSRVDELTSPERLETHPLREYGYLIPWVMVERYPTPENKRALADAMLNYFQTNGHADVTAAVAVAELGFTEEAFDALEKVTLGPAGTDADVLGVNAYRTHLLFQSPFPALRQSPRFAGLCARLGLAQYWTETGRWPDCAVNVPYDFKRECEIAAATISPQVFPQHIG